MIPQILRSSIAALALLSLLAAPALAQDETEPMPPPAPEPEYEEPQSPALPPPPAPAARPAPAPAPGPATSAQPVTDATSPVVRVQGGEWGFGWIFGGLATLSSNGPERSEGSVTVTEVAIRYALSEAWRIKFGAGTHLSVLKPDGGDASTQWGLSINGGFEYHFRIWRRISPFFGARMGFGMLDPSGDANWMFGITLGPQIGIEYFIADRVSVAALYQFQVEFQLRDPAFAFIMETSAGGSLQLAVYF